MTAISESALHLLRLGELPGVGAAAVRRLITRARVDGGLMSVEEARERLAANGRPEKTESGSADNIVARCVDADVGAISALDASYPPALRHIEDYPPILYYKGDLETLQVIGAAVVGTREASKIGLSWARQIAELMVKAEFVIVSGLALGIDTAGHEGALRASGRTVAILAHGLHIVTPSSNRDLAERILLNGGTLLSEHAPGVPPRRAEYVRRNRIQSGMSVCSIVVESGDVGGAIHQGNFTRKQGRRLFCVVPDQSVQGSDEFKYGGAEKLVNDVGAVALHNRDELTSLIQSGALQNDFARLSQENDLGIMI